MLDGLIVYKRVEFAGQPRRDNRRVLSRRGARVHTSL